MLSPDAHEEACKLFCTWLHRLEERDRRNAEANRHEETNKARATTADNELKRSASNGLSLSTLSESFNNRTEG